MFFVVGKNMIYLPIVVINIDKCTVLNFLAASAEAEQGVQHRKQYIMN
jgi:hypothetical protein